MTGSRADDDTNRRTAHFQYAAQRGGSFGGNAFLGAAAYLLVASAHVAASFRRELRVSQKLAYW